MNVVHTKQYVIMDRALILTEATHAIVKLDILERIVKLRLTSVSHPHANMELVPQPQVDLPANVHLHGKDQHVTLTIIVSVHHARIKELVIARTPHSLAAVCAAGRVRHARFVMHVRYLRVKMVRAVQIMEMATSVSVQVNGWVLHVHRGIPVMEVLVVDTELAA